MVKPFILLFLLVLTSLASAQDNKSYVDSVSKHRYIIVSWDGTPNAEISRYSKHIKYFLQLEYRVLDSLYDIKSGVLQFYAFAAICRNFPEKVSRKHERLFRSKSEIMALTGTDTKPKLLPVKDVADMTYENAQEKLKLKKQTENAIQSFILDYAKFPESYKSISFDRFHLLTTIDPKTAKTDEKTKMYVIGHHYQLKDSLGVVVECFNTFKLNSEFMINVIEAEESDTYSSFPPRINEWLKLYGRNLTEDDKKKISYNRLEFHK